MFYNEWCLVELCYSSRSVDIMVNIFIWIEIPVEDIERAARFYSALFEAEVRCYDDGKRKIAILPGAEGMDVGGSLTQVDGFIPSSNGPLAYIGAGRDLCDMLDRVEPAGGKVVVGKTPMGEFGYFATFHDSEGNTLALHSTD
jgi:predicted enzyme related to lactoylglutathione lyase